MSGRIKSGIRKELFGVIFFILVVNVVVLLFMGSTLFERFYQSNKVSELEQSARAIRAAYQENSGEIYDAIGKLENGNAIVSLFEIGGDGRVQMRYHSRTGREEMRPWGDRENAPKPRGEDVDRFQEKMLARLRDSDESFDVRLEESFNPWEDDGMLTLSTRLDDNLYLYIQTPRGYLKSFADLAVKYTALMSIAILLVGLRVFTISWSGGSRGPDHGDSTGGGQDLAARLLRAVRGEGPRPRSRCSPGASTRCRTTCRRR